MKLKDIEGALSLIAAFKNGDWVEEHLKALLVAKTEAEAATARYAAILVEVGQANKSQQDREKLLVAQQSGLDDRESRLKNAEEQHQFRMEQDSAGLAAQEKRLNERYEAMNAEHAKQCEARAAEAAALDKREKELLKRTAVLQDRQEGLEAREVIIRNETQALNDRMKKLRELTA